MKTLFIVFISLFSCSADNSDELFGVYTSPEYDGINRLRYGDFVLQLKLDLKEDYTYEYTTCAQKEIGKWELKNNKLELYCEDKKFIIDSLNNSEKHKKGKICDPVKIFSYEKGRFQQKIKIQNKDYKLLLLKQK